MLAHVARGATPNLARSREMIHHERGAPHTSNSRLITSEVKQLRLHLKYNTYFAATECTVDRRFMCRPLEFRGNYIATSNDIKLVHWPLMGGLLPTHA